MSEIISEKIWKIQLRTAINFMIFKDTNEERLLDWKSDNIILWLMIKQIKLLKKFLFLSEYQIGLETTMDGSCFIFDILFYCNTMSWITFELWWIISRFSWLGKKPKRNKKPFKKAINAFNILQNLHETME